LRYITRISKKALNKDKPEILIYHTHTSESFGENGNYNDDPKKNIVDVGEELKAELENNYGISVIHDTTVHNNDFNRSYYKSRETVDKYMKKYGDFKLVIDMHRDALYSRSSITTKMNGENVTKVMFVLTKKILISVIT
jgi:Stage II sporulation protein P (SpoIIP).